MSWFIGTAVWLLLSIPVALIAGRLFMAGQDDFEMWEAE